MQKLLKNFRVWALLILLSGFALGHVAWAQDDAPAGDAPADNAPTAVTPAAPVDNTAAVAAPASPAENTAAVDNTVAQASHDTATATAGKEDAKDDEAAEGVRTPFDPENGTWINPLSRMIWGVHEAPKFEEGGTLKHVENRQSVLYDQLFLAFAVMLLLGAFTALAAKKRKIRPEGKPHSLTNFVEFAVESFREYLIGVMGKDLAVRYAPLISSFFFTILCMNWLGLVPGLIAPTSNPNVPVSLGLVAFFCVHIIAIKEAGFKSWIMHFVGEPLWLAPLNFPLHIIGELVKPVSLSLRLLCNVFGEEMVIAVLAGLAATSLPIWLPIPFQLPMLFLGTFFGFLQALVFSTLLAIYISIFATHHDDHDEHNTHGHVEHVRNFGHNNSVAHPTESPVA